MPFLKGHKFYKGGEKNWFKKGKHSSIKTEFKNGQKKPENSFKFQKGNKVGVGNARGKHWIMRDENRKNMSRGKGKKNPNWKGGIKTNPYPAEFDKFLKLKIRTRDNFTCCLCGRTEREELEELGYVLCVNHIDFNKKNCSERNLNTLCRRCNVKINREREYWTNYFNKKYD
jgi:hypothetical protein